MGSNVKWVRLGDYIVQSDSKNSQSLYGIDSIKGISTNKGFIETKANLDGVSLSSYKLVPPSYFAFVPDTSRRGDKMALGFNESDETYLISSIYCVFNIINHRVLLPEYLYLLYCRPEFDRFARYNSWGSAREVFSWDDMCNISIPLPSLEEQQKVVNAWKACREIKEQNEAKAAPLMQLCQSYIQELKHKYPAKEIGPYIHRIDERNADKSIKEVRSVSVTKDFNETNAKVDKNNLGNYKIVRDNQISFVQTTGNEKCLCAAINHLGFPIVVTSVNEVFETDENYLNADYLHMIFRRKETDRYARFHSWGSARETFTWEDMKRFSVPLPPIDVQRAIVNIYKCANEAKQIAEEADKLSRAVCPALLQHIIHSSFCYGE